METDVVRLGAGTFAIVFAMRSRGNVALKQVFDPMRSLELEKEFIYLKALYTNFQVQGLFHLPKPLKHYCDMLAFQTDMSLDQETYCSMEKTALYTMQRVWPIPPKLSAIIQEKFFPPHYKSDAHCQFIARICLGQAKTYHLTGKFFNPKNFPLGVEQLKELGLPVDQLAYDMGLMLGSINFAAGKDGHGIEFVFGGDAVDTLTKVQYFCIDFNRMCDHHGLAANIVDSFLMNNLYYPSPGTSYWYEFIKGYLAAAHNSKPCHVALACAVINNIEYIYKADISIPIPFST